MINLKKIIKKKLRKYFLQKRLNPYHLKKEKEYKEDKSLMNKSEIICSNLEKIILQKKFKKIMFYYPIQNEVNVFFLLKKLLNSNKSIFLPHVFKKPIMQPILIKKTSDLKTGFKNILNPNHVHQQQVYLGKMDLVVVPGLAFTPLKYRLGYGGGFYDYYLSHYPPQLSIGVFYHFQKTFYLPIEKNDIKIHKIITEKKIFE